MREITRLFLEELIKNPRSIASLRLLEFSRILQLAKEIFEEEDRLIELNLEESEHALIVGDIHGNLPTLLEIIKIIDKRNPKFVIFLGDYVDRGEHQLECLVILLALKILNKEGIFLLKGNHEDIAMNQYYGFLEKFLEKYYVQERLKNFEMYNDYEVKDDFFSDIISVYITLPLCATINNQFLCLHGGVPEDFEILDRLKGMKPADISDELAERIEHSVFQMMWNDPEPEARGFVMNYRGPGVKFFGEDVFLEFLERNKLAYVIRAHECFPEGYRWFFKNKLLSIFSSSNYRGKRKPNPASYAVIRNNKILLKLIHL